MTGGEEQGMTAAQSTTDETGESPLFEALADPTRRSILGLLGERTYSVQEIATEFPVSRPAISKHLRVLRAAGLVIERQRGRCRYHELCTAPLEAAIATLQRLCDRQSDHSAGTRAGLAARSSEPRQADDGWRCW